MHHQICAKVPQTPIHVDQRADQKGSPGWTGPIHQRGIDHEKGEDRTSARRFGQGRMIVKPQVPPKPKDGPRVPHWPRGISIATSRHRFTPRRPGFGPERKANSLDQLRDHAQIADVLHHLPPGLAARHGSLTSTQWTRVKADAWNGGRISQLRRRRFATVRFNFPAPLRVGIASASQRLCGYLHRTRLDPVLLMHRPEVS